MNKGKHAKQKFQVVEIYTVLLLVAFIFMSIGYAQISDIDMIISGQATATAQNGVFIYDVGEVVAGGGAGGGTGGNAAQSIVDTYFSTNLGTTVVLGDSTDSTISYNVSLYNNSNDKYVFVGVEEPVIYNNANKVKNEYITYSLSDNMKAGETIIGYSADNKNLDFTVTFKYKDGAVPSADADKVLNSLLNFRFRLLPMVSLNAGDEKTVIDSEVCAIYPGFMANDEAYENGYEYQFTVENAASGSYNKVPMKYTLSIDSEIGLPEDNDITESPLVVELCDLEGKLLIFNNAEEGIEIAGDGTTSPLHNYILRVKWNSDAAYNSAKYAGKTFTYKVNFVGTPTVETAKYLGYTHNKSFVVEITTASLNFNVSPITAADIFMESNGKASLELEVSNTQNGAYDVFNTVYNVKVTDNTKFTPTMSDTTNSNVAISADGIIRTLNGGQDSTDNFTIDFAADVNDIARKEIVNVVLSLTSPYTKEITIPVNIRSIVMSAKNVKDGSAAIGTNAQVTNGNVKVTINCDGTYLDSSKNRNLQYAVVEAGEASLSENSWQIIATSEISNLNTTNAEVTKAVSANGNVYARYFDGSTGKGTASVLIDNIDKVSPNAFSVKQDNVSTYSIKVSGSTTDRGSEGTAAKYVNINGYQYQIKNSGGTALTSWTPETTNTSYTFVSNTSNNLEIKQNTKYIVSMRAVDLAGNYSEEASVEVTTDTVADSKTLLTPDYSPKTPTNGSVTVTFKNNSTDSNLKLKYQIGSTSDNGWNDYPSAGVSVSTNTTVYARLFDTAGQYTNTASATVKNIDKESPVVSTAVAGTMLYTDPTFASGVNGTAVYNNAGNGAVTVTRITNLSGTPTGKATGLEIITTGEANPNWGGFTFRTQSAANKVFVTKIIAKIPTGYTINWKTNATGDGRTEQWLTSQAGTGNWQEYIHILTCGSSGTFGTTSFFALSGGTTPTASVPLKWYVAYATVFDSTKYGTSNSILFKATDSGTSGVASEHIGIVGYGINQSDSTQPTYTPCDATISLEKVVDSITANGTYHVWVKDQAGNTGKKAVTVSYIDRVNPTTATVSAGSITGTGVTLTGNGADANSGVAKYRFYIYQSNGTTLVKDSGDIASTDASKAWTWSSLSVYTQYKAKVVVYDAAGNSKTSDMITFTTKDTVAPNKPTLSAGSITGTSVTLTGNGSDANSGIAKYRFYIYQSNGTTLVKDSGDIASTDASKAWTWSSLSVYTTYKAKVVVYDKENNSNTSDMITFTTKDTVAPNKPTLSAGSITGTSVTLTGNGSDANSGIAKYRFYIYQSNGTTLVKDSGDIVSTDASKAWTWSSLSVYTQYKAKVVVYDKENNSNTSDMITFTTKDTVAPTTATVTAGSITTTSVTLTGNGADANSGVAKYRFYIYQSDGTTLVKDSGDIASTATSKTWTYSSLTHDTTYKVKVIVYDASNNSKTSDIISFTTAHQHTGNSTDGGGCYTGINYHTHDDVCYDITYNYNTMVNQGTNETGHGGNCGGTVSTHKCSVCGAKRGICRRCGSKTCSKGCKTVKSKTLNCSKTIDSYYLNCGK